MLKLNRCIIIIITIFFGNLEQAMTGDLKCQYVFSKRSHSDHLRSDFSSLQPIQRISRTNFPPSTVRDPNVILRHLNRFPPDLANQTNPLLPSQSPRSLKNGSYIFLIDENGILYTINRYIKPDPLPTTVDNYSLISASHEFLYHAINSIKDPQNKNGSEKIKVFSAGEFVMKNGEVVMLTNQSGTFRGSTDHLIFAEKVFRMLHFSFSKNLAWVDVSLDSKDAIIRGHANVNQEVQAHLAIDIDPRKRESFLNTQETMKLASKDISTVTNLLLGETMKVIDQNKDDIATINAMSSALYILASWANPFESEAYLVNRVFETESIEAYPKILEMLRFGVHLAEFD